LRRVRAVVDSIAIHAEPHFEQLHTRIVLAAVMERSRSPELLADQLFGGIVLALAE
jgi:hypothetical protein